MDDTIFKKTNLCKKNGEISKACNLKTFKIEYSYLGLIP